MNFNFCVIIGAVQTPFLNENYKLLTKLISKVSFMLSNVLKNLNLIFNQSAPKKKNDKIIKLFVSIIK